MVVLPNLMRPSPQSVAMACSLSLAWVWPAEAGQKDESIVLTVENDIFTGSDDNYTNGVSITWSSDELSLYEDDSRTRSWAGLFDFAPGFESSEKDNYLSLSLVQEMNTPTDITVVDPPLTEQPYSGVMLFNTSLLTVNDRWAQIWNLGIGAVGPITQVDHTQISYHKWIGADEPRGWDTQLPNEAIFNIGYLAGYELFGDQGEAGLDWRVVPITDLELGTYATAIGGGVLFEFGTRLEDTFGTASLGQGLSTIVGTAVEPTSRLEVSAYLSIGGYGIARYLPLDGTAFRESRSVDREPFVGMANAGVTARYKRLIASFGVSLGSTQFDFGDADLDYGAISIGWLY